MAPPLLVCDFDGTLTLRDVGDALCDRFAPPRWRQIDERWLRGELSLPEAQRQMWSLVRATPDELVDHARRVGDLREGADALFDAVRDGRLRLVVASGGFGLYVDALLGDMRRMLTGAIYGDLVPTRDGVRPEFLEGWACERVAICKARVVRHFRADAFCGDGSSDRCAAGVAPRTFAVAGGRLERECNNRGIPHVSITSLDTVVDALSPCTR